MSSHAPPDGPDRAGKSARDRGRALREAGPYLGLGTTLAATVGVGVAVGHWLDGRLGTEPWFLLAGGIVSLGAALTYFFRKVSDLSRQGRNR